MAEYSFIKGRQNRETKPVLLLTRKRAMRMYYYNPDTCECLPCPKDYDIETVGRGHYVFHKKGGEEDCINYSVDTEEMICSCPDFLLRHPDEGGPGRGAKRSRRGPCKHLKLALFLEGK